MRTQGNLVLLLALCIFAIFVANIAMGATTGAGFLSDVGEMITLLIASICFVIVVLGREQQASSIAEE